MFHNCKNMISPYIVKFWLDFDTHLSELFQWLKHEWMSHLVIWTVLLKGKEPTIELQSQEVLVYPGIELNPETGQ